MIQMLLQSQSTKRYGSSAGGGPGVYAGMRNGAGKGGMDTHEAACNKSPTGLISLHTIGVGTNNTKQHGLY